MKSGRAAKPAVLQARRISGAPVNVAATLSVAVVLALGTAGTATTDDNDPDQQTCDALRMGLSPDDIAERLGRNDPHYFNYWRGVAHGRPAVLGGDCG
jgi:hypothetical protein